MTSRSRFFAASSALGSRALDGMLRALAITPVRDQPAARLVAVALDPSAVVIRKLLRADVTDCAALLADAFADNPCYAFMHPRVHARSADLRAFFVRNVHWHVPLDLTWVAAGPRGELLATATLEPPGGVMAGLMAGLRHWVWPTLRDQGTHTLSRVLRADHAFKQHNTRVARSPRYWHVHAVAVAPSAQGRGVGTQLMRCVLDALRVRRAEAFAPCVLSTQRVQNVRFYERLGFRLVEEQHMCRTATSAGFRSWFMRLD